MNQYSKLDNPSFWFWGVATLLLLWNSMGVAAYLTQVNLGAEALAELPEAQRVLMENTPVWVTTAFAIAVFIGLMACIVLLLRFSLARLLFGVSLIAVLVQNSYWWFFTNGIEVMGKTALFFPVLVILILLFSLWFCTSAKTKNWIR